MLEIVVLGATVALAVGASGAHLRRRVVATRWLAQYATSRRHVFVPAPAARRRSSPRVEGEIDGVRFAVDLHRVDGALRTRVSAESPRASIPKLTVVQRGALARAWPPGSGMPSGGLEHVYRVDVGGPEDVDALRARAADGLVTLSRRNGVWLVAGGTRVTISWQGLETDPLVLDAARDAAVALASVHRSETPYR